MTELLHAIKGIYIVKAIFDAICFPNEVYRSHCDKGNGALLLWNLSRNSQSITFHHFFPFQVHYRKKMTQLKYSFCSRLVEYSGLSIVNKFLSKQQKNLEEQCPTFKQNLCQQLPLNSILKWHIRTKISQFWSKHLLLFERMRGHYFKDIILQKDKQECTRNFRERSYSPCLSFLPSSPPLLCHSCLPLILCSFISSLAPMPLSFWSLSYYNFLG